MWLSLEQRLVQWRPLRALSARYRSHTDQPGGESLVDKGLVEAILLVELVLRRVMAGLAAAA